MGVELQALCSIDSESCGKQSQMKGLEGSSSPAAGARDPPGGRYET